MMPLPPEARDRLAKIAGLLSSDHDGERATAAAKATELLRNHGTTWGEFIRGVPAGGPERKPEPKPSDWRAEAAFCGAHAHLLTAWEAKFIDDLGRLSRLSAKQRACLGKIVDRLRKESAR